MRRIFQCVAFALLLLLLAPAASSAMVCSAQPEQPVCSRSCCDGMAAMSMPMPGMAMPDGNQTQLRQTACCTVTATDAVLTATPETGPRVELVAAVQPVDELLAVALPAQQTHAREHPPGRAFLEPTPSLLCTFLI